MPLRTLPAVLTTCLLLSACSGTDGAPGERGAQGEPGPAGAPGPAWTLASGSGLTLAGAALGTDPAVLQRRVTQPCAEGSAVRQVNADGTVVCAPLHDSRLGDPVIPDGSGGGSGDCLISQVTLFAGTFAPRGWMVADGRLLLISQNTPLFSLLGTTYGGNGQTTFALPNLQPLAPAGVSYIICISGVFPSRPD